jgi:putative transposase
LATRPRKVFSWNITKLRGPEPGIWYSLLIMIDIFSRYVVGWMPVRSSNGEIATEFIKSILERENIAPPQAVVHADRGTEMTAKPVCDLLDSLGVSRSHSRPRVSDDNPYSESQFRTMKYCPTFPERFGSIEDARAFMRTFFPWSTTSIVTRASRCSRRRPFSMDSNMASCKHGMP